MGTQPSPAPVVMKFGGSSVASLDAIQTVAKIVAQRAGQQPVVVVVSAMGGTTDRLVSEASTLSDQPPPRELDMLLSTGERHSMALLAIAIQAQGTPARSLTGSQCGILTTHRHTDARVMEARPFRIQDELSAGRVVVVGGFQGVSYQREVTTLGRGGSDTTAVVLAAALGADCEIYSDVDGVYSTDPRTLSTAEHLDALDYDQMLALSRAGAKVLHASAVEYAKAHQVAIYARSTQDPKGSYTVIKRLDPSEQCGVAIAQDPKMAQIYLRWSRPMQDSSAQLLAQHLGPLDLRFFSMSPLGAMGYVSLRSRDDLTQVQAQVGQLFRELEQEDAPDEIGVDQSLSQVSCIASSRGPELVSQICELAKAQGIPLHAMHLEAAAVHTLVAADAAVAWTRAMHDAFRTAK